MQFKFETCINVMGFKQDRNGFARSKCWADMTYKQGVEQHQLNFKFFGPISQQQFLQDLKRYKEVRNRCPHSLSNRCADSDKGFAAAVLPAALGIVLPLWALGLCCHCACGQGR